MKHQLLIVCMCLLFSVCRAQDYKADMQHLSNVLLLLDELHAEAEVSVYESLKSAKPYMVRHTEMKKRGADYLCRMDDITMLFNDKVSLMIYESERQIVVSENNERQKRSTSKFTEQIGLDVLTGKSDSIRFNGITGNQKHYTIHTGSASLRYAEVYIDTKTGFISKIVYYYNTDLLPHSAMVVVDYKVFNTAPKLTDNDFSEQRFVKHAGKKFIPAGKYAGYNILNYDPEKF